MQILLIILILLLGGVWGYYGYLRLGRVGGIGLGLSIILIVALAVVYLLCGIG